jgi:hypothetical protein
VQQALYPPLLLLLPLKCGRLAKTSLTRQFSRLLLQKIYHHLHPVPLFRHHLLTSQALLQLLRTIPHSKFQHHQTWHHLHLIRRSEKNKFTQQHPKMDHRE